MRTIFGSESQVVGTSVLTQEQQDWAGQVCSGLNETLLASLVPCRTMRGPGSATSSPLLPAELLCPMPMRSLPQAGWQSPKLDLKPGVSLLLVDLVVPGGETSVQRPWPGNKTRKLSFFDQGLEGR